MDKDQELFNLVDQLGEICEGKLHIIDTSEYEVSQYRVYHADGYCFDISREPMFDEDSVIVYCFYSQWDEFKELTVDKAIELINQYQIN